MPDLNDRKFRIAYLAHSLRSDWNNGNAHFLRGLMRSLGKLGHRVTVFEPAMDWSVENLLGETRGEASLAQFAAVYPELDVQTYGPGENWKRLGGFDFVVLHEWNAPELARVLLRLRGELGFRLLFHDTHHRASSTPEQMEGFGLAEFDGIVVFGDSLRRVYRERWGLERVWTLHEAADTSVFRPAGPLAGRTGAVWIGNWGDGERSAEISEYFLRPASELQPAPFTIFGVRYPEEGLEVLAAAAVEYGGYLPNLEAPAAYAGARLTVHIPRQQYSGAMTGIPTIRVFEALASGIPLVSAPWEDSERLFREGDFCWARNGAEMTAAMRRLFEDTAEAEEQARRGLETVMARHTCDHRAVELTKLFEEIR